MSKKTGKIYIIKTNDESTYYIGFTFEDRLCAIIAKMKAKYRKFLNGDETIHEQPYFKVLEKGGVQILLLSSIENVGREEMKMLTYNKAREYMKLQL